MDVSIARPALWGRTVLIFGSEQKATRWLQTRLSELDDRTPEEVLAADANSEAVDAILDRIEYGVFR
jgi:putative toxin-antitoxin system antitoxin component (TIGR02293 family)